MSSGSVCQVAYSWVDVGSFQMRLFWAVCFAIASIREFMDTASYLTIKKIFGLPVQLNCYILLYICVSVCVMSLINAVFIRDFSSSCKILLKWMHIFLSFDGLYIVIIIPYFMHDLSLQKGYTPLHLASTKGCRGIIEALVLHGASINHQSQVMCNSQLMNGTSQVQNWKIRTKIQKTIML
jgi:hypothetical protein